MSEPSALWTGACMMMCWIGRFETSAPREMGINSNGSKPLTMAR